MKYKTQIIIAFLLLLGGWYLVSNNSRTSEDETDKIIQLETEKLSIVTSFYPLQFAIEQIVGDLGIVTNIGAGKDPHDFEPTAQNILALQKADLVVLQGAAFEPWGDNVIAQLKVENVPILLATAAINLHENEHEDTHEEASDDPGHEEVPEHGHGAYDPHTWLDPILFGEMVANIADKIATIDPDNALRYRENASLFHDELIALDAEYKHKLANCELDDVITSHDAFSYLAERYNFKVHSISGLSTQDVPSATTLAELKEEAEQGISTILIEENSLTAYAETLARETGLQTLSINSIAYIVPAGDTYLTLMQNNLNTFTTALKCNE